ncbi:peptidoglycan recognition protein family protein [Isoptericola sp. NPDC055881]
MSWYACARKRQINWLNNLSRGGVKPNVLVFHLSAGEQPSLFGYFSGIRHAGSHFHVARDGAREQYAGTGARSAAEYGAKNTISVETQGADAGGRWTAAQCESLAVIAAEAHMVDGIPLRLMERSDDPKGGIGWHRLGVDGNFPSGQLGGRLQRGGVKWSGARGKACPGDNRIPQIPGILERAKEIVAARGGDGASRGEDRAPVVGAKRKPHRLPTLRLGSRRWQVRLLQNALLERGYKIGKADSSFGPMTASGVREFQEDAGIDKDGVAGPDTWFSLCRGAGKGAGKYRNKIAQRVAGLTGLQVTGRPGSRFISRWKAIQRWLGVDDDGDIGTKTIAALVKRG